MPLSRHTLRTAAVRQPTATKTESALHRHTGKRTAPYLSPLGRREGPYPALALPPQTPKGDTPARAWMEPELTGYLTGRRSAV